MQVPLSQRRHTNVAAVRYSKNGVKLEVACYKNKVLSFRSGVESRLDEVLQIDRIFTNISRGLFASSKDIQNVFGVGTTNEDAIKFILLHGELQVARQEREAEVDQMFTDISVIISQKCISEVTRRPFPPHVIEQALRSIGAGVKLDQPAKKQALALMHKLIDSQIIPITRSPMKLRFITSSDAALTKLLTWCEANGASVLESTGDASTDSPAEKDVQYSFVLLLQPHLFRNLENYVKSELGEGSTVHMLECAAVDYGESDSIDAELAALANSQTMSTSQGGCGSPSHNTVNSSHLLPRGGAVKSCGNQNPGRKNGRRGFVEHDDMPDGWKCASGAGVSSPSRQAGSDSDEEDFDVERALAKLGLDKVDANNDHLKEVGRERNCEDGTRRGKKKEKRRQGKSIQQKQSFSQEVRHDSQHESDEDVLVNRKQRKMAAARARDVPDSSCPSEDGYDYGLDEGV
ncbi:hypothetical protein TRVL_07293 [Trypanosoma vivax]|nr:hypothetical protein TRVL_07293 [Trypanosoma vivax]